MNKKKFIIYIAAFMFIAISILYISSLTVEKKRIRGYARQIYNYINGGGNLNNFKVDMLSSISDQLATGLQHGLKIQSIDLSNITKAWGPPNFSSPAYFFITGDNIYIVNNIGELYEYSEDGIEKNKIRTNLPNLISNQKYKSIDEKKGDDLSGRLGIKSITYNPDNNFVYVAYHKSIKGDCYAMAIDRALFSKGEITFQPYYVGNFCRANFNGHDSGGRIGFIGDKVILTIGAYDINLDSRQDEINNLMNPSLEVGAVVEIDSNGKSKILSKGHRNQQGLAVMDSNIFISEQGPMGGDQFIRVKKGDNYGWPFYSYGFDYLYKDIYKRPKNPLFSEPVFYFLPSVATSQMVFYRGNEFPRFNGKFILSSLKAGSLFVLSSNDFSVRVQSIEQYDINHRIRDLLISRSGKILMLTDDAKLLIASRDLSDIPDAVIK